MIVGSGRTSVLSESDIVAMGSMKKILKGKMCNGCRRGNIYWQPQCKDYILRKL